MSTENTKPARPLLPATGDTLRLLCVIAGFGVVLITLWWARSVLLTGAMAIFMAVVLDPVVRLLQRRTGRSRGLCSVITAVGGALAVALAVFIILRPFYSELQALLHELPAQIDRLKHSDRVSAIQERFDLSGALQSVTKQVAANLPGSAGALFGLLGASFGVVVQLITMFFLTLFALIELPSMAKAGRRMIDPSQADQVAATAERISVLVARYVGGALSIGGIAGVTMFASMWVIGVPYALALAVLAALLDLIPMIGATIAGTIMVLVALSQSLPQAVAMLVVVLVYQQVENNIVQPAVQRKSVRISGYLVMFSVMLGSAILGVLGAIIAVPVAASLQLVISEIIEARDHAQGTLPAPETPS